TKAARPKAQPTESPTAHTARAAIVLCVGLARPLDLGVVAREADRIYALNAACDTALHLLHAGHPAAEAVALDALDALGDRPPPPVRWPRFARVELGAMSLALALVVWPPAPEAPTTPEVAVDAQEAALDALEVKARREGRPLLAAAARRLKEERRAAQAAGLQVDDPPTPETPPQVSPRPNPPPMSPETKAQLDEALALAQTAQTQDDALLRELGAMVEAEILGMLEASPLKLGLNGGGGEAPEASGLRPTAPAGQKTPTPPGQEGSGQDPSLSEAAERAGFRENEMGSVEHERDHLMESSFEEMMKERAEQLARDLNDAMGEAKQANEAERSAEARRKDDANTNDPGELSAETRPDDGSVAPLIEAEKSAAEVAAEAFASAGEAPDEAPTMTASGDGDGKVMGGGGADGGAGASSQGAEAPATAPGETERVSARFSMGALSQEERAAIFGLVADKSVVTQGGDDALDERFDGYFEEAERALDEEELPPLMEGLVRAYFLGLKETP
ncbi:MAG: hypothetical protein RIT28_4188, partial [Pseudomonadota bacterium]